MVEQLKVTVAAKDDIVRDLKKRLLSSSENSARKILNKMLKQWVHKNLYRSFHTWKSAFANVLSLEKQKSNARKTIQRLYSRMTNENTYKAFNKWKYQFPQI